MQIPKLISRICKSDHFQLMVCKESGICNNYTLANGLTNAFFNKIKKYFKNKKLFKKEEVFSSVPCSGLAGTAMGASESFYSVRHYKQTVVIKNQIKKSMQILSKNLCHIDF